MYLTDRGNSTLGRVVRLLAIASGTSLLIGILTPVAAVLVGLGATGSGLVVMVGLLAGRWLNGWTAVFLASTVATSVTGFFFPFHQFTPAHGVGIISLALPNCAN